MSNIVESVRVMMALVDRVTAPARAIMKSLEAILAPAMRARKALQALMETSGMQRLRAGIAGITERLRGMTGHLTGLLAPVAAIFSGGAIAGMLGMAHATSEYADNMMDASKIAGVSFEAFQALNHVAEQGGVSTEDLSGAFNRLNKNIGAAKAGMPKAQQMFAALGISAARLAQMSPDETFLALADALEKISDPSLKASAAMAVFGKAGANLLPMMNGGSEAMREMMDEARRLGIVMDEQSGEAVAGYADNVTKLMRAMQGLQRSIASHIIPTLEPLVERMTEWIAVNRELIATRVGEVVQRFGAWLEQVDFDRALTGISDFIGGIQRVVGWLGGWGNAGIVAGLGMTGLLGPVLSVAAGIGEMIFKLKDLLPPMFKSDGAVARLAGTMGDLSKRIGGSLVGAIMRIGPAMMGLIPAVVSFGAALAATPLGWAIGIVAAAVAVGAAIAGLVYVIHENWDGITQWFADTWDRIEQSFFGSTNRILWGVNSWLNALTAPLRAVAGLFDFKIPQFDIGGAGSAFSAPAGSAAPAGAAVPVPPSRAKGALVPLPAPAGSAAPAGSFAPLLAQPGPVQAQVKGELVVRFLNPPAGTQIVSSRTDSPGLTWRPDLGQAFGTF